MRYTPIHTSDLPDASLYRMTNLVTDVNAVDAHIQQIAVCGAVRKIR